MEALAAVKQVLIYQRKAATFMHLILKSYITLIYQFIYFPVLTLNLPNFLNGRIHFHSLELSITILSNIKIKTWSWSANSTEPCQTAWMCTDVQSGLALYLWQRFITFGCSRVRVNSGVWLGYRHSWKTYQLSVSQVDDFLTWKVPSRNWDVQPWGSEDLN